MKVYVVFDGCYSARDAVAVFTDEKKANLFASTLSEGDVSEFESDEVQVEGDPTEVLWRVNAFYEKGKIGTISGYIVPKSNLPSCMSQDVIEIAHFRRLVTLVKAATQEAAIKKASDRFAKYLAEKEGL